MMIPKVAKDPRFKAGRSLVRQGKAASAIEIFASLLEEARTTFGDDNIESAPAYYEYGNALLRDVSAEDENTEEEEVEKLTSREAAAKAAEKRLAKDDEESSEDKKPTAKTESSNNGEDEPNDTNLALEMMETAWSIVDEYGQSANAKESSTKPVYMEWAVEQSPRYLTGIGDTLSMAGRHADAADAYSRALEHRLEILRGFSDKEETNEYLKCRRLIVEANILIAEEFLACPDGEDVVTTETKDVLVKAAERVDYARGYYDKARDELQETVLLMGQMAAKGVDVKEEKEDICFVSTMVMGVGMKLSELDELAASAAEEPKKKKSKKLK